MSRRLFYAFILIIYITIENNIKLYCIIQLIILSLYYDDHNATQGALQGGNYRNRREGEIAMWA